MIVLKFRNNAEHEDILKKVKRMKKFTEELEDCLEEASKEEDDYSFRGGSYRRDYDDEDMRMEGRYGYRRGRG